MAKHYYFIKAFANFNALKFYCQFSASSQLRLKLLTFTDCSRNQKLCISQIIYLQFTECLLHVYA